jgi:hypothetical protein
MSDAKRTSRRSGSSPLRPVLGMKRFLLLFVACALALAQSGPALSTSYNFPGSNGAPTDLNGWMGGVTNFLLGTNLQVALLFLHNPVNVLTGTYTGCTAGSGSGCVKGNARTGTDGTWSSGNTFTAASLNATSADTGKSIWITERNLDTIGTQFSGTVTFVNSTTLTLSATPSFSGSMTNAYWVLGVDDGTNLTNAIASGDIFIPAGTYLTQNSINITTNYHNIQCADNAILITPHHGSGGSAVFSLTGASYNSIIGCNIQGSNVPIDGSTAPGYDINNEFDIPVYIKSGSNNNFFAGNHFAYSWGNSEFLLTCGTACSGGNSNTIVNNWFEQGGHYCWSISEGNNNIFEYNKMVDCDSGSEGNPGDPTNGSLNTGNIFAYNKLLCVNGDRGTSGQGCMYLTGGNAAGVNYGGNQVFNNQLSGCGSLTCSGGSSGIRILEANAPGPAIYTNNQCGSGCSVH